MDTGEPIPEATPAEVIISVEKKSPHITRSIGICFHLLV